MDSIGSITTTTSSGTAGGIGASVGSCGNGNRARCLFIRLCIAALDTPRGDWDIDSPRGGCTGTASIRGKGKRMAQQDGSGVSLKGLRVMVIDDSKTIRRTAETLLVREGCEVVTATDGFEALSKIADQNPQIIFVDIMMPRLDGYQTCALIKNNQTFKSVPVIMLSSKDGLFDKARGRIVGSEQYLTKPFTREELLGAIRNYVNA